MSERPVRESAPPPPKSAGPPFGLLALFALAILFTAAILLGVGGQFAGWIVAGVIAVLGGILLVIRLAKQNRAP